jgi:hypothetical protein
MAGTGIGYIDFEWLVANLRVAKAPFGSDEKQVGTLETLVMGPKGIMAVEAYVTGLFQLYPTLYLHKATRGIEKLFSGLLARVIELVRDGGRGRRRVGIGKEHALVRFAENPDCHESILPLDDALMWATVHELANSRDPVVGELATRIRDRKLYKCIDVREELTRELGVGRLRLIDRLCAEVALKIGRWRSSRDARGVPRVLIDEPVRTVYRRGPIDRILVQLAEGGPPVDIAKTSAAVRATHPFKGLRVYYRDDEARKKIEAIIRREKAHGRRR